MIKKAKPIHWTLLALLLLAFALRVIGITQVPPGLSGDESMNGADAQDVWGGDPLPVFFPTNYGREAFFLYLMALGARVWGVSALTIRLPAILCGMAGLVFTYVLLKRLWNERVALLTLALLSVSFWPIFTSRVGLRAVSLLPWEALGLYALWRGLRERRWVWWGVTGLSLGILTYTYIPGRFFAVVPLTWLGVCAVLGKSRPWEGAARGKVWGGLLLAAGLALLIFAPFGRFIAQHPEQANQRIQELNGVLQQLRAGNFRPAWQSIYKTLGMFTFQGERDWYYNVSGRPLFDGITGMFFYAGVLLALFRLREPRSQLLLIWAGVMLAPSMLAVGAPSVLRATGAQIPLYVFPALACDALWRRLDAYAARHPAAGLLRLQRHFGWIAALGLGLVALRDGQAYFVQWAQEPRTREIYRAGLAQIGAALDAHMPLPDNAQVFVGCDYAADLCRDMVRFQTRYTGPIHWFVGRHALIFPQTASGAGDVFYFLGDALPPDAILHPWRQMGDGFTAPRARNGAFESAVMHIPAERRSQLPWTPESPLAGQFQNGITLLGYDLPSEAARGQEVMLIVYWRAPDILDAAGNAPLWFHLRLKDAQGNVWDERANLLPYQPWDWAAGDGVAQTIGFPIPPDAPPVALYLDFGLEQAGHPLSYIPAAGEVTTAATLGPLQATGAPVTPPPDSATRLGLAGEIALGDVLMIGMARPGERLSTTLHWYALAAPRADYALRFQWRQGDCAGPVVHTESAPLLLDLYPTSRWQPGESLRSTHAPIIPRELAPGQYGVALDLVPVSQAEAAPPSVATACYPLILSGRIPLLTVPAIPYPHRQMLSDGIQLLGYDLAPTEPLHPGDSIQVTLYWQATAAPSTGYTVFVHLYRPDGQLAGQHDGPPCEGECPTFSWVTEEILVDTHRFTIDSTASPGDYRLGVGMYSPTSLERLPIPDVENDVILLPPIAVQE